MKAKRIVIPLAALFAFISLNRNLNAQEYFRNFDTRSMVYYPMDYSIYNEPLYPTANAGLPTQQVAPSDATRPQFESTSYLEPAYPPTASEEDRYNWAVGPFRFNVAAQFAPLLKKRWAELKERSKFELTST